MRRSSSNRSNSLLRRSPAFSTTLVRSGSSSDFQVFLAFAFLVLPSWERTLEEKQAPLINLNIRCWPVSRSWVRHRGRGPDQWRLLVEQDHQDQLLARPGEMLLEIGNCQIPDDFLFQSQIPDKLKNLGTGDRLANAALDYAMERQMKIRLTHPFLRWAQKIRLSTYSASASGNGSSWTELLPKRPWSSLVPQSLRLGTRNQVALRNPNQCSQFTIGPMVTLWMSTSCPNKDFCDQCVLDCPLPLGDPAGTGHYQSSLVTLTLTCHAHSLSSLEIIAKKGIFKAAHLISLYWQLGWVTGSLKSDAKVPEKDYWLKIFNKNNMRSRHLYKQYSNQQN